MRRRRGEEDRVIDSAAACPPPGSGADAAGDLRRQLVLVDDLSRRLETVVRALPREDATAGWWGPARGALQEAVNLERARLGREIDRLDSVRIQLGYAAEQAAAAAPVAAVVP